MTQNGEYSLTKRACYLTGATMAIAANLSPLLFVTFRNLYGISYTLLGFLVVINFFTQLLTDLVFAFFSKHFNIHKTVRMTPLVVFVGLVLYAVLPILFPKLAFLWIVIGTIIFSVASGLNEVLTSPVIAAIPSDNPERDMSKLHSMYAWGVVVVVLVTTFYIKLFGAENWPYLALLWSVAPLTAFIMFSKAKLPKMEVGSANSKKSGLFSKGVLLCALCIFMGGAAECTMSQWASGFIENALGVPKVLGDMLGVVFFAILLGTGRTLYSKYGRNIINFMLFGMIGATVCYIVAGAVMNPLIGVIACAVTGLCTCMLWPGTLICVEEKIPDVGVAIYAFMAAGGDLGASVGPQMVGVVSDTVSVTDFAKSTSAMLGITAEQVGMRAGLLSAAVFPLAGIFVILYMKRYFKENSK